MSNINTRISYTYIEYTAAMHMEYKHLFVDSIYDYDCIHECPLIITWAEPYMHRDDDSGKCLAIAAKTFHYSDDYKVSLDTFKDMLQAFFIYPENDDLTNELRLEFAKAILKD